MAKQNQLVMKSKSLMPSTDIQITSDTRRVISRFPSVVEKKFANTVQKRINRRRTKRKYEDKCNGHGNQKNS